MTRLIDADVAIDMVKGILDLDKYYHPYATSRNVPIDEVIDRIEQTPTIDKELIRCKDCKWHIKGGFCDLYFADRAADEYCSRAERKDE